MIISSKQTTNVALLELRPEHSNLKELKLSDELECCRCDVNQNHDQISDDQAWRMLRESEQMSDVCDPLVAFLVAVWK